MGKIREIRELIFRYYRKRRRRRRGAVIQRHHIRYADHPKGEWIVKVYKGEHWICTQLQRRTKHVSKGFITALREWIKENEDKAVELK